MRCDLVTQKLPDPEDKPVFRPRVRERHAETAVEGFEEGQGQVPAVPGKRRSPQKKNKGNLFKRAGKGDVRHRADTSVNQEPKQLGSDGLAAAGRGSSRGNLKTEPASSSRTGFEASLQKRRDVPSHKASRYSFGRDEPPAECTLASRSCFDRRDADQREARHRPVRGERERICIDGRIFRLAASEVQHSDHRRERSNRSSPAEREGEGEAGVFEVWGAEPVCSRGRLRGRRGALFDLLQRACVDGAAGLRPRRHLPGLRDRLDEEEQPLPVLQRASRADHRDRHQRPGQRPLQGGELLLRE